MQQSIEFKPHTIIKENTVLSPIKNKKIEQPQEQNIQPNDVVNKKIEQPQEKIIQPNDVVNKNQVSNLKNNENNDSSVKTPASRLKKSERKSAIQPFSSYEKKSSNEKRISTPSTNLNDILNKIQVFNTNLNSDSPPGSNKQLLHEKIKKNANLLLDAPEIQKKKNKRIFSISILEKVEELSKMDNLMQKE